LVRVERRAPLTALPAGEACSVVDVAERAGRRPLCAGLELLQTRTEGKHFATPNPRVADAMAPGRSALLSFSINE
jgi:hypothetical protein